jgi:hypothetical protein
VAERQRIPRPDGSRVRAGDGEGHAAGSLIRSWRNSWRAGAPPIARAKAIIELARDRRHVGGTVGVMTVLHTWMQQLVYHPRVHASSPVVVCPMTAATGIPLGANSCPDAPARRPRTRQDEGRAGEAAPRPYTAPRGLEEVLVIHCTAWADGAEAVLHYVPRRHHRGPASSGSTTRASPSVTNTANRRAGARSASTATSSCAASSSACCRRGSTRCATRGSGIPPGAIMQPAPDKCCRSIPRQSPSPRKTPPTRMSQLGLIAPYRRPQRNAFAPAARPATSGMRKLYPRQVRGP